ncbi:MAG: putative synthase delta chain [Pseudomonadota bacterium]|jgi:F-type H+-transporting ATPase subunit delta
MAELLTVARPYAEAAFGVAQDELGKQPEALVQWSQALDRLAAVGRDPAAHGLLGNPHLSSSQLASVYADTAGGLSASQQSFVKTLAENGRLGVLEQIKDLFRGLRFAREGRLSVEIQSAMPLSDAQRDDIVALLSQKFGKPVQAEVSLHPELIGGVSMVIGDEVIDASVSGKLNKMASALMN